MLYEVRVTITDQHGRDHSGGWYEGSAEEVSRVKALARDPDVKNLRVGLDDGTLIVVNKPTVVRVEVRDA